MVNNIVNNLTENAIELSDLQEFIFEQVYMRPDLMKIHGIQTGIKMKEQIVFASQFGKTGIKGDATCTRKNSGAASTLSEKFWEPVGIEDTLIHCNAQLSSLFKAYFTKITEYREKYDITGTDIEIFFSILLEESMQSIIWRAAWYGDTAVAVAGAAAAGLVAAGDVKFYDYLNGLWKQVFAGVVATDIERVTITENAVITSKADQLALAAGAAVAYFKTIRTKADSRLRSNPNAQLMVTREIYENYTDYLESKGVVYDINITQDGLESVKWQGIPVINMETVWGLDAREDFLNNTTDNVYDLPHRIVYTLPANIPIGTLNENDFTELDIWYEKKERENNIAFGFSLDAKLLEEYMIVVAY